jgi:chromatin remodeling complex protein RSC6
MATKSRTTKRSTPKSSARTATKSRAKTTSRTASSAKAKSSKTNSAFMQPMMASNALAKVVGSKPLPRTEITKKLWVYIKKHDLQDPKNRRNIIADANLKAIFDGKKKVTMFEMPKYVSKNLSSLQR